MNKSTGPAMRVRCSACPLRKLSCFAEFSDAEEAFMSSFKSGELDVDRGSPIVMEGSNSPHLFTVLEGMGIRYKTLEDGRRQVIGFIMPGDFVGLQAGVMDEMQHSVEASTKMLLCVFRRTDFHQLFRDLPQRGYDVSWLAAREEHFLGDYLLSVGRRSAMERVAFALWSLHRRAFDLGLAKATSMDMPFTQLELADAVGLSLVHTSKTLKKLRERGVADWSDRKVMISDPDRLLEIAGVDQPAPRLRPLI